MRVIFLNRFYWPDEPATAQLLADLAEDLATRGHQIAVIASHPGGREVPRFEHRNSVAIERVRTTHCSRSGLLGKAVDYASFFLGALWRLARIARRGDVVVAMTDPPLIGVGACLVATVRRARLIHWVQDIYPELAITLAGHHWLRAAQPLRNLAWRRAALCVTLGSDMAATVSGAGVDAARISVLPNWSPAGLEPQPAAAGDRLRRAWGLAGKFVVAYSGNLGRVHDLDPVLDAAAELRDDPKFIFVFVGDGPRRAVLEAEAARRALPNVQFRPPQPRPRLAESLALADVHLVTLRPGCERYVFPSKLAGVVTIGRPVVFIGPRDCELARHVRQQDLGVTVERGEIAALATALRSLASDPVRCARHGAAAVRWAATSGGVGAAAARWDELLRSCELAGAGRA